jgi:hypothetical protein
LTRDWTLEVNGLGSLGRKLIATDIVNRQFSLPLSQTARGRFNPDLPDISYRANQGSSSYHALTALSRYRTQRGLFQLTYTWSHVIDNQSDPLFGDFFDLNFVSTTRSRPSATRSRAAFTRQFDSSADRGNADFDQRHNFVFYSHWVLPNAFASSKAGAIFRNWQFAQMAAFRTGFPYSVYAFAPSLGGAGVMINQRADIVDPARTAGSEAAIPGGLLLLNQTPGEGFATPARGTTGTSGRNAFRGPGIYNVDISISRSFRPSLLGEAGRMTFRADVFNLLNHANLNGPANVYSGQAPGTSGSGITNTFGHALYGRRGLDSGFPAAIPFTETARQVQLIFRIEF